MSVRNRVLPVVTLLLLCVTCGCRRSSWPLWSAYSARFIDANGRVFDPNGNQRTTSEGQAYAMFFALVANDRADFDRVLNWTQSNLAQGDLTTHLPAWLWGQSQNSHGVILDSDSASDADIWTAYSLIEAGRLWDEPRYSNTGRQMLVLIANNEVADLPDFGPMLMPGQTGFQREQTWTLNPSYVPVFVFDRLAEVDHAGPWHRIALNVPRLIEASARHGFAMDWVEYFPGDGFYPASEEDVGARAIGEKGGPGGASDAIRVYLWAGMQYEHSPARARLVNAVSAMNGYLEDHDAPPERVSGDGIPDAQDGPVGFSAAMLPYLRAFPDRSAVSAQQMIRMSLMKDTSTGLYGKGLSCYDQNLALFSTGFIDGRFSFGPEGELKVNWTHR